MEKIAKALRSRREELSLSQRELARDIGVHSSYISKIEKGAEMPSPSMARKLARALDADPLLFVLAAGHVPDELRKVIVDRDSLRMLLRLSAADRLSEKTYRRLRELVARENQKAGNEGRRGPDAEGPRKHAE